MKETALNSIFPNLASSLIDTVDSLYLDYPLSRTKFLVPCNYFSL